jgi:hypothetical protein
MASQKTKSVDIGTEFRSLSSVASSLNKSSDELNRTVAVLDEALRKLNIGLSVWVSFAFYAEEPPHYGSDQIGYAKVGGKWGVALRSVWGDESSNEENCEGPWLFGEAPRDMRLIAVDYLPRVIEELGKKASSTAKKLDEKTKQVKSIAAVIEEVAKEQNTDDSRGVE